MWKKIVGVFIVCLFIGIIIHPTILCKTTLLDKDRLINNEYKEVNVEVYGINNFNSTTFFLTCEESEKLNSIIDRYKNELETVNSLEESEYILYNTLDNLSSLGLINSTEIKASIETAKKEYENISFDDNKQIFENNMSVNFLAFIALRANSAYFMPSYIAILYNYISNYEYFQEHNPIFAKFCDSMMMILALIVGFFYVISGGGEWALLGVLLPMFLWVYFINPFPIGYSVAFLGTDYTDTGWIYAIGLKGIQAVQGKYLGALGGFTGLRLFIDSDYYMFGLALGSAIEEVN